MDIVKGAFLTVLTSFSLVSCKSYQVSKKPSDVSEKKEQTKVGGIVDKVKTLPSLRKPSVQNVGGNKVQKYILDYASIAKEQMEKYKIPASIILAQGILESGAGTGDLTLRANNHFGIKCHDWNGAKVYHDDDKKQECFRKYSHPRFSYQDHSIFLTTRSRYVDLFRLPIDDYKSWAKGLRKAGYATDPKYPSKLIRIIQNYELFYYDAEVLGKSKKEAKKSVVQSDRYVVKKGDTLYSIARKHKLSVEELKTINGLGVDTIFDGQVLFVKPLKHQY